MSELPGVQEVYCGTQTIVHMKQGSAQLSPEVLKEALTKLNVECEGIERDDKAVL